MMQTKMFNQLLQNQELKEVQQISRESVKNDELHVTSEDNTDPLGFSPRENQR